MERQNKYKCEECGHICEPVDILEAKHPFIDDEKVMGCPECREIDSLQKMCEVDGCNKVASCGTPASGGYLICCGEHSEKYGRRNK
ncbi:hypothetical protein WCX49_11915 [Sulfurimonas sp. HSL-1656]|uniref:hypothetical protein n=1 Tax=Thiomicrolovo subterrani TaxID=3131934 RepID=UPI0031F7CBA0